MGGWSTPRPGHFTPWKKTRYPLSRRLGGPQDRAGRVWKSSPLAGIRSPDRLARSESLYRLSYPDPLFWISNLLFFYVFYSSEPEGSSSGRRVYVPLTVMVGRFYVHQCNTLLYLLTSFTDPCKSYHTTTVRKPSSWRWTLEFETRRRHQKIKN